MRGSFLSLAGVLTAALTWCPISTEAQPVPTGYSYSVTPLYHFDADLDEGGEAGFGGALITFGHTSALDQRTSLGWRAHFDYQDWSYDDPVAFGGNRPWDKLARYGLSVPFSRAGNSGWVWNLTPTVGYSGESGADFSEAIEYGATLAAVRRFRDGLTLGFGLGFFRKVEDSYAFPLVMVNWRINDRWSLSNPSPGGPAGPAGLELAYVLGGGWDVGFGAAQRNERYRLDSGGPFPDGVGEHRYTAVLARVGYNLAKTARLSMYAGAEMNTKLRVEDSSGNRLYGEEADAALMIGLSLAGRF
ncbi:MAG: hypothetical protein MUE63_08265 [Xanthomonadales bacterium]|jgi:hypothetical protein|nr:hypothetical protein [Xanthomonadales bacterium]